MRKENAFPTYAPLRGSGHKVYELVRWRDSEHIANYVLFEDSMHKAKVSWKDYDALTTEEKTIYVEHMKAIHERKLNYICPQTKCIFKTVSQLLFEGNCCGNGCRHCPYLLENCPHPVKNSLAYNGAFYC